MTRMRTADVYLSWSDVDDQLRVETLKTLVGYLPEQRKLILDFEDIASRGAFAECRLLFSITLMENTFAN